MKRVITFGTFDVVHEGHINILRRAKELGDYLIVGVSSDELNERKHKNSIMSLEQRLNIVGQLKFVDEVFVEESLDLKNEYIKQYEADLLVMGDDWRDQFDWVDCETIYLPRTDGISSTEIKLILLESIKKYKVLFADCYLKKHLLCAQPLQDYLKTIHVFSSTLVTEKNNYPDGQFDAIIVFNRADPRLREIYPETPIVLIDHGASNLKWFLASHERYTSLDYFLTAGEEHVASMQSYFGVGKNIKPTAYVKSDMLLSPPEESREKFCEKHELDPKKDIVLYAPTWFLERDEDIDHVLEEISKVENHIVCQHVEKSQIHGNLQLNVIKNENNVINELMKHADIIISDTSSILFESAALGKKIVQLLLKAYPDNPAVDYEYPLTAGTGRFFVCGLPARPRELRWAIENVHRYTEALTYVQRRILQGTRIRVNARRLITENLIYCINAFSHPAPKCEGLSDQGKYKKNLLISKSGRVIAHAGGMINGESYTNSLQAIQGSSDQTWLIELDFIRCQDGIIAAHDGTEEAYGLSRKFSDVTTKEFKRALYKRKFTTLSLEDALDFLRNREAMLVLDLKAVGAEYRQNIKEIGELALQKGVLGKLIPQAYCYDDFACLTDYQFYGCIVSLWKYFDRDALGTPTIKELERIFGLDRYYPVGIALRYKNSLTGAINPEDPNVLKLLAFGVKVYVHGQPPTVEQALLARNFGLFRHDVDLHHEPNFPAEFKWKEYLHLNRDLIGAGITTEDDAKIHWLRHGQFENRRCEFDCPPDFDWKIYAECNPDLAKAGLTTEYELKAHLTCSKQVRK